MTRFTLLLAPLFLIGCAAYEPPGAGKHRAPGEARADTVCNYEALTSTKFQSWRCIKRDDLKAQTDTAQREADAIRMPAPIVPY